MTIFPQLAEILPHAAPLILIDEVLRFEGEEIRTSVRVNPKKFPQYAAARSIPAWIGLEYMAQSVAAYVGLKRLQAGKPIVLGLFLGSRRVLCHVSEFSAGETLLITAKRLWDDSRMGVFACSIQDLKEKKILMDAQLNVFQPRDQKELEERLSPASLS